MDINDNHNRRQRKIRERKDQFTTAKLVKNMINPDTGEIEYEYYEGQMTHSKTKKKGKDIIQQKEQKKRQKQKKFIFQGSDMSAQQQQQKEVHKQIQQKQQVGQKVKNDKFIFQDDEESESEDNYGEGKVNLFGENADDHQNSRQNVEQEEREENEEEGDEASEDQSLEGKEDIVQKKFLTPEMRLLNNMYVHMQLWRQKNFFGGTEFQISLESNHRMILAAKKTTSGFILSRNPDNYSQNSASYLGKAKFNFTHNHMDFFLPGLSPSNAIQRNVTPRELIISLDTLSQNLMEDAKPRQFETFLLKQGYSYHRDLEGYQKGQQISLGDLYRKYPSNKNKIMYLRTRKSKWNEKERIHYLNMKGRAKMASVKNFILENPDEQGAEKLLLGKIKQEVYNVDIHSPLNTIEATAIALSSFLYKNW